MLLLWIECRRKIHLFGFPLSITFLSIQSWWCQLYGFVKSRRYSRIRTRLSFASWNVVSDRFSSPNLGINIDWKKPLYLKGRHSKHSWLKCAARPMVTLLNPAKKKVGIAGWLPFGISGYQVDNFMKKRSNTDIKPWRYDTIQGISAFLAVVFCFTILVQLQLVCGRARHRVTAGSQIAALGQT